MRRLIWIPIVLVLALLLGACVTGLAPETPRERLAALEISYQAANLTIQDLVAAGTLKGEAADAVAVALEGASDAMRVARAGVDGLDALALLQAANTAVVALTARLREAEQ